MLVGAGFAPHLLVLPLLGLAVGALFRLSPELALGLFIVSLCPAGTTSNALTFVGRGNVALAVVLTALTSLVTVFTIPIVLSWAVPWFLGGRRRHRADACRCPTTIRQLCEITLDPDRRRHDRPPLRARPSPPGSRTWLRPTAFVILVVVIVFSVIVSFEHGARQPGRGRRRRSSR